MGKGPHARKRRQQDRGSPQFLVAVSGHRDEACWLPRRQIVRSVHVALPRPRRPIALEPVWFHQCPPGATTGGSRSEEHTSELQSLMRISYDVFCLKKKKNKNNNKHTIKIIKYNNNEKHLIQTYRRS